MTGNKFLNIRFTPCGSNYGKLRQKINFPIPMRGINYLFICSYTAVSTKHDVESSILRFRIHF
jgi:hypothetical protein